MDKEWLTKRVCVDEAEKEHLVSNELWESTSPEESWKKLRDRAGIHLVHGGQVVASIVTMMS